MSRYATFVVRVQLDDQDMVTGGQISAVSTQETMYFRELTRAVAFIESYIQGHVESRHQPTEAHSPGEHNGNGSTVVPEGGSGEPRPN